MTLLTTAHSAARAFASHRTRRSVGALAGVTLVVALAGTPVALAGGGPHPGGPSDKTSVSNTALNFGYGNRIQILTKIVKVTPPPPVFKPPAHKPPTRVFTPPPPVQRGTLPFTGSQLSIFMIVGFALLLGGAALRITGRRTAQAPGPGMLDSAEPVDPFELRRRLAIEAARLGGLTGGRDSRPA
jgi:hypothetical protein